MHIDTKYNQIVKINIPQSQAKQEVHTLSYHDKKIEPPSLNQNLVKKKTCKIF